MSNAIVAVFAAIAVLLGAVTNVAAPSLSSTVYITYLDCPDNVNDSTNVRVDVDGKPLAINAILSSKTFLAAVPLSFPLAPGWHWVYVGNGHCGDSTELMVIPGRDRHFVFMGETE